jgi:hypothetical protein
MRVLRSLVLVLIGSYAIAWVGLYILLNGSDFSVFWLYLRLSWTGGLERVTFIQVGAVMLSLISTAIAGIIYMSRRLRQRDEGQ